MATLTVWKYPTAQGAKGSLVNLEQLQREELITIVDAAVVSWPEGKKKPRTEQLHHLAGDGALSGTFWGMLFGLIFFVPFLGAAVGAGVGAVSGKLRDVGIDDEFISQVREEVTPGTSALFLLSEGAVRERVAERFEGYRAELIRSNMTPEQEQELQAVFGLD